LKACLLTISVPRRGTYRYAYDILTMVRRINEDLRSSLYHNRISTDAYASLPMLAVSFRPALEPFAV
jgi:hypothetical protein